MLKRFKQEKSFDYHKTFATIVKPISYKALFAIALAFNLEIKQLDIQIAFLYRAIDKQIFVEQLTSQEDGSNCVCFLNNVLYDLKQALQI